MLDRPSLTKGRITVPDWTKVGFTSVNVPTATSSGLTWVAGKEFAYNPNTIDDGAETEWGSVKIPGASHPVYQFGSGGERLIAFELFLDADRCAIGKAQTLPNGETGYKFDLTDEITWYKALRIPMQYGPQTLYTRPPIAIFTFGTLWKSVPCLVKKVQVKVNYFTPDLRPVRATITLNLAETVNESVDVFQFFGALS